VKGKLYSAIT